MHATTDPALDRHLDAWLGAWPPPEGTIQVVASPARDRPGWDGAPHPMVGVVSPSGGIISVAPACAAAVRDAVGERAPGQLAGARGAIAAAMGHPGARVLDGVFRWSSDPVAMPDAGQWVPAGDPAVPPWLRPFGGEVLVHLDGGRYVAGVGLKRHHPTGWEIAVGTEPEARGRGLARALVSQAARRVVAIGAVATYIHAPDNTASAKVAAACGFPDLGWRSLGLFPA